ncbi:CRISPR-associated helicase Cas3' [bacterium]|nr:CRISPR-associated helicase Cas3' [bacterium]
MDKSFSDLLYHMPGKTGEKESLWLPFWMHSIDTNYVIEYLLKNWVPEHIKNICESECGDLNSLCSFIALTHDIGKLTPVFTACITEKMPKVVCQYLKAQGLSLGYNNKIHHARAGEIILTVEEGISSDVAAIVGAHHGKPQYYGLNDSPESSYGKERNFFGDEEYNGTYRCSNSGKLWRRLREEWFNFSLKESGYESKEKLPQNLAMPVQLLLSGLIIMADWISSNTHYFPLISIDSCGGMDMYPQRAEEAWERLKLPGSWSPMNFVMDEECFKGRFNFYPNAVQLKMLEAVESTDNKGGIYILEAQMGIGKTEAALAAAEVLASKEHCGGIFFGLPTQATANGIFPRLTGWANIQVKDTETDQTIRLAHGLASLNEDYRALFESYMNVDYDANTDDGAGLVVHPWFNGNKQALLANFVIGTVDQLLLAALKQKHVMLRHLGLAGKVVIIDECHAYDAYMNQYLERALNWLGFYKVPVILLSATLPESSREKFIRAYLNLKKKGEPNEAPDNWKTRRDYPLLTWAVESKVYQTNIELVSNERNINIERLEDESNIPKLLRQVIDAGGCCGIIVNTVRKAQELRKSLAEELPEAEIILFHSCFIAPDRACREKKLLERVGKVSTPESRKGLIVIGTQVLEQSLDIDFDLLITQLCPMDLLFQRLGRLHRHTREERPLKEARCYILEADEGSKSIYGEWLLLRTDALLPCNIALPRDIPKLVQDTYNEPETNLLDDKFLEAWEEFKKKLEDKKKKANDYYRINKPSQGSLHGLLTNDYPVDGSRGEAAVRDSDPSITVLVMREKNGEVAFLPWQCEGISVSSSRIPDDECGRKIAEQRLNLPLYFSKSWNESETIEELERINKEKLSEWQNSSWIRGELVMLLDENLQIELCGQCLKYDKEYGLIYSKQEK